MCSRKIKFLIYSASIVALSTGTASSEDPATEREETAAILDTVVVTTQYREQSLTDISASIQVVNGLELDQATSDGFSAYVLKVPTLSYRDQGNGSQRLAIRGLSNVVGSDLGISSSVSTVGLYLNDVPIQSTSIIPDLSLYDLDRIEVLKGPQGTLYGDGAMGGAIRMLVNKPQLDSYSAKAKVTVSDVQDGGLDQDARGAINAPLVTDVAGLRVVGTFTDRSGYIQNQATMDSGVNSSDSYSLRANLLVRPTNYLDLDFLYMTSEENRDGFSYADINLPDLTVDIEEPLNAAINSNLIAFTGTLKFDFGTLTAVSSFFEYDRDADLYYSLAGTVLAPFGATTNSLYNSSYGDSFAQEFRFVSADSEHFEWVSGIYYRKKELNTFADFGILPNEVNAVNESLQVASLPPLPSSGVLLDSEFLDTYEQYAIYWEGNYYIGDSLTLTGGLRWYDETTSQGVTQDFNSLFDVLDLPYTTNEVSEDGVVAKLALGYDLKDNINVYASAAQGFRSPLINGSAFSIGLGTLVVESDTSWNYEVGFKSSWYNGNLIANGSAFLIDWQGIQSSLVGISPITNAPFRFIGNGPDGQLTGVEFEAVFAPYDNFSIGGTIGYTDAKVAKGAFDIDKGSPLPNTPEITASAFVEFSTQLTNSITATLYGDVSYQDEQLTRLQNDIVPDGAPVDEYTIANAKLAFDCGDYGFDVFVNNLGNKRAQLGYGQGTVSNFDLTGIRTITRPRTIGAALRLAF